ncbi:MAG: hypothetical protein ACLU99_00325 [Alphaproteobacteria bacterium]
MSIDTLVYEKKNNQARIAALASGEMRELEIVDFTTAGEGNIYLGRITRKIDLANGKTGYFLDIGDSREAFINAEENGMDELVATEGQKSGRSGDSGTTCGKRRPFGSFFAVCRRIYGVLPVSDDD